MLVLKGLVGLHRTIQLQLLHHYYIAYGDLSPKIFNVAIGSAMNYDKMTTNLISICV